MAQISDLSTEILLQILTYPLVFTDVEITTDWLLDNAGSVFPILHTCRKFRRNGLDVLLKHNTFLGSLWAITLDSAVDVRLQLAEVHHLGDQRHPFDRSACRTLMTRLVININLIYVKGLDKAKHQFDALTQLGMKPYNLPNLTILTLRICGAEKWIMSVEERNVRKDYDVVAISDELRLERMSRDELAEREKFKAFVEAWARDVYLGLRCFEVEFQLFELVLVEKKFFEDREMREILEGANRA
ncbi:hypothetical protein K432DRAFT_404326 [Lepidopterella palustris CBS 459.81]|uniref:Uncharacterized protein n=1 Tax=Lepidopterella palustris CBS 459.81 TaxID=1314670 RepID=A0A8E2EBF5_9PEZI|nr:hypothetical protein K432DRAFT_404326 [Lepidopterella palustris CBS 459.81]